MEPVGKMLQGEKCSRKCIVQGPVRKNVQQSAVLTSSSGAMPSQDKIEHVHQAI
jgi:hypothetical protein